MSTLGGREGCVAETDRTADRCLGTGAVGVDPGFPICARAEHFESWSQAARGAAAQATWDAVPLRPCHPWGGIKSRAVGLGFRLR